jgi:nucleoside-diphosphate-sugar epimerase
MRIFLTGGTGFLGSHFLAEALAQGHEVVALRRPGSVPKITLLKQPRWLDGSLEGVPESELAGIDVLVHLAAHGVNPLSSDWKECFHWNVFSSLQLWLAASQAGVRRFVIAGSCFEYGMSGENYDYIPADAPLFPTGAYHSSKAAASMAALGFAVDQQKELIILRPFHIYGEGEAPNRFWSSLKNAAISGNDYPMTEGTQVRDFTPVGDVVKRFLVAVENEILEAGVPKIENVGSGKARSLLHFATEEWNKLNARGKLLPGAIPMRNNEVKRYVPKIP